MVGTGIDKTLVTLSHGQSCTVAHMILVGSH
jgi:hypothetical protein